MITITFLVIILVFSVYCFYDKSKLHKYLFHPYSIKNNNEHYRFLTHAFIHGSNLHLLLNVFALWTFGYIVEGSYYVELFIDPEKYNADGTPTIENMTHAVRMAKLAYIGLFTGGIYASSITEYFRNRNNPSYSSLGASGAIEAIIFAYIMISPKDTLYFFVLPMPAWLLGVLFLAGSYYLSKRKQKGTHSDNIGHEAHFWGAIFGAVYTIAIKPQLAIDFVKIFIK